MKKFLRYGLIFLLCCVFLYSGWMLLEYFMESGKQQRALDELAALVEENRLAFQKQPGEADPSDPTEASAETLPAGPPMVTVTDPKTGSPRQLLADYAELYLMNQDFVGWICIEDTKINYPVMQSPDRPNFYLRRSFSKESSSPGSIYAHEYCSIDPASDNITLYGHNRKDGSMFATLLHYKNPAYYEAHPLIRFDTLTEYHTYQIIAVFRTTASIGEGFLYHEFTDAFDAAEFDQFVATCKSLAMYDTGHTAVYGDKLISLSTCEYSQTNGRLVVVAKRIT